MGLTVGGGAMRRVIHVEPADPRWDAFVLAAPDATVFHHSGWLAALEHENGQHLSMLACEEADGTLSAILPVMETRGVPLGLGGAGTGRRLSSLPRTPVAGPLGQSQASVVAVVGAAIDVARASRLRLQLKTAAPLLDGLVPGLEGVPWRLSYVKRLPADPDDLRFGSSRNHARIGWAVRKAEREGLRVRDALDESELKAWHRLYLDVNRRRGLPSRPYRMFQAAWERLRPGGFLRLLLVHQRRASKDHLVAGSMLLMLGRTTFYAFNGVLREALPLRPNDLLQWHAMRQAAAAGYTWYDFGEVAEGNEGLAGFKAKWDTETRRLVRYHAPPLRGREARYAIDSTNRFHEIALGAWQHVPLSVTAYCGDRVHRFL